MRRYCDLCGFEADDYWMKNINVGRKTIWICWECYQNADREANLSDMIKGYKLHKISESKKRRK